MKKIYFFLILYVTNTFAQEADLKKANAQYKDMAYVSAIETYLKVAEKGYRSKELFQKLGDSYYFNAKLKEAYKWYAQLFKSEKNIPTEYYYRYAQTLKATENYKKADEYLIKFHQLSSPNDIRAKLFDNQRDYKSVIEKNSGRCTIETTSINSKYSDYGPAFFGDKVIFSTTREKSAVAKIKTKWTNDSFTNLFVSNRTENNDLKEEERFAKKLNSKFHEDTPVFTKDLKTVYFTRNNFLNGKVGKDKDRVVNLKIYKATINEKGEWGNLVELPFNSDLYNVAHPALSPDEKTLFFASDMPGTVGQSDLYKVEIFPENKYGKPVNLGKKINTEAKETFPFLSDKNELYFASDGHPGLGGLDIFVTLINDELSNPILNVGKPINGPMDDFALIIDSNRKGYFSSNRDKGKGSDDIYSFLEKTPLTLEIEHLLEGIVTDVLTKELLPESDVSLFDDKFNVIAKSKTDDKAAYRFKVIPGKKYYVRAEKPEYDTNEKPIDIPNQSGKSILPLEISKKVNEITEGSDLAKIFGIKNIYFDLDKSDIREDAAVDLAKIVEVMKQYPTMKVDVRSHTDCRQTAQYNLKLSDRRAKSSIAWMVTNGIEAERLTGKGYGESQLVNDCGCEPTNESNCTEEEHQENRRSEFIVMKM